MCPLYHDLHVGSQEIDTIYDICISLVFVLIKFDFILIKNVLYDKENWIHLKMTRLYSPHKKVPIDYY